jgi:multimeric flavodoxin WrbA
VKRLLIVYHTQSGNTRLLAEAVLRGALAMAQDGGDAADADAGIETKMLRAADATLDDLLTCHGLIIGTPENFGYMAGMVKDFLDRVFYPAENKVDALPYALFISAGNDGTLAPLQIERILTGLRMRRVHDAVIVKNTPDAAGLQRCEELGAAMAAGLALGMY